jgi:hypothetical protein
MSAPAFSNDIGGLFETLVSASAAAAQVAKFKNPMLERCFNDFESTYGTIGNTLQINIPVVNVGNVSNIGDGPLSISATDQNTQTLQIAYNASSSRRIQSFDQIRTPQRLKTLYLDGMIEEVTRYTDNTILQICLGNAGSVSAPGITTPANTGSFLTTNLPVQPVAVAATTVGQPTQVNEYTRIQLANAWATLIGQGADMTPKNGSFITNQVPYSNMIADVNLGLIQQYIVGDRAAEEAQQTAKFAPFLNSLVDYDQFVPLTASEAVSGPPAIPASKYYGLMFHRFAVGFKPVLQEPTNSPVVIETTVFPKPDFPVRVQFGYDFANQGWILAVNTIFAAAVIRPEWGVLAFAS